jgi:CDP-glycerol glycerophosphotransferase
VDRWDLLVSPNAASTPLLRGAFAFEGELLETGYPRNDVLSAPDREAIRARVRAELGIPDGVRAVLYAPTWRDNVLLPREGGASLDLHLDLERFARELGEDHVLLLRLHYFVAGRVTPPEGAAVRDVSFHPEMSELYLAADVLVTDYSSAMFDFAVTGRPILLYTYDLAAYRDDVRGFYFDLPAIAPGPQLETTPELVDALRDLSVVAVRHEERYAAFRERFCHLEDGRAADRVLAGLLAARAARRA